MSALWQDVRYALRALSKAPGFTFSVVLCLALGIGTNIAVFSIVDAALLRPLPCRDPGRLMRFYELHEKTDLMAPSGASLTACRKRPCLEGMAGYGFNGMTLTLPEGSEILCAINGTTDLLKVLGIAPIMGRDFLPDEDTPAKCHVALMTRSAWQRRFGGDRDVVGKVIVLNREPTTIIGVIPDSISFLLPPGSAASIGDKADILTPLRVETAVEEHWMCAVARLKDGVSTESADRDLGAALRQMSLERSTPGKEVPEAALIGFNYDQTHNIRLVLLCMQSAGLFVLLIACVNAINLMFARAVARQREIAVRIVTGASRFAVVRLFLVESLMLSLAAGVVGTLMALWEVDLFLAVNPVDIESLSQIRIDATVFGFALLLSVLPGAAFGVICGLRSFRPSSAAGLVTGARAPILSRTQHRLLSASIAVQVALTLVLLSGASLMINSFWRLSQVHLGFRTKGILTALLVLPEEKYADANRANAFYDALLQRAGPTPHVLAICGGDALPVLTDNVTGVSAKEHPDAKPVMANFQDVTSNYFDVMGISLVAGRCFDRNEGARGPAHAVVSRALATKLFGSEEVLGKIIAAGGRDAEIIGVASDVRPGGPSSEVRPVLYMPFSYELSPSMWLAVRIAGPLDAAADDIKREARAVDPEAFIAYVHPMDEMVSRAVSKRRFALFLLVTFSATALLLATFGVYGLSAYSVSRRTHEIGIRMALGARSGDILFATVKRALALAAIGGFMGLIAASALNRYLQSVLYEIGPWDPVSLGSAVALLAAVTTTACYMAARNATKVDPMTVMRTQ